VRIRLTQAAKLTLQTPSLIKRFTQIIDCGQPDAPAEVRGCACGMPSMDVWRIVLMAERVVGVEPHEVNLPQPGAGHFPIQFQFADGLSQPKLQVQGRRPLHRREFAGCILAGLPLGESVLDAENDAGPLQAGLNFDGGRSSRTTTGRSKATTPLTAVNRTRFFSTITSRIAVFA
jgi:hypothetical protein